MKKFLYHNTGRQHRQIEVVSCLLLWQIVPSWGLLLLQIEQFVMRKEPLWICDCFTAILWRDFLHFTLEVTSSGIVERGRFIIK